MADTEAAIQRLKESRPPATDNFTYLTIIDKSLSPEILPTLLEILQDVAITSDIGWDLVDILLRVPGSEECLQTVAQLGNPREVILKVLEALAKTVSDGEDDEAVVQKFIILTGMLGILHKRLEVKAPSRFLHTTLQTVYHAYLPTPEVTAAVIDLVRSLSGRARPPLPTRKSSITLTKTIQDSDPSKSAPDPEAEATSHTDPSETVLANKLLQSFVTSIIEVYVNSAGLEWAPRLHEFYNPDRKVPGRKTLLQEFNENETLLARDALIGQLVALAGDLGLSKLSPKAITEILESPLCQDPLSTDPDPEYPDQTKLSTGGFWCLTAYWLFAKEVFDGDYDEPDMSMFPDHFDLLQRFLGDEPQSQITTYPGTVEALLVMGLWLESYKKIYPDDGTKSNFMAYHHLLTLCSVFHPSLHTRNVATALAGHVLHADPDPEDRLKILEDLLENCVFASLQACAVTWLREELIIAQKRKLSNPFSNPDSIESLQYALFPNVSFLKDVEIEALWEYWVQNHHFHMQAANFAYFLFAGDSFKHLVPEGMPAAVEQRYVDPLLHAAKRLEEAIDKKEVEFQGTEGEVKTQLRILADRLQSLPL